MCTTLCVSKALYHISITRYHVVEWDNPRLLSCLRFVSKVKWETEVRIVVIRGTKQ